MLPTEKASHIHKLGMDRHLSYSTQSITPLKNSKGIVGQHLYIISDDDIKEGDHYVIGTNILRATCDSGDRKEACKKIIATTDSSLGEPQKWISAGGQGGQLSVHWDKWNKKEKLPQPSTSFIEKYIESYNAGKVIEEVDLEMVRHDVFMENIDDYIDRYEIKTRFDNTVITHQSKMYSKEQTVVLCLKMQHDYSKYKESCHYGPNMREIAKWTNEWLENNL